MKTEKTKEMAFAEQVLGRLSSLTNTFDLSPMIEDVVLSPKRATFKISFYGAVYEIDPDDPTSKIEAPASGDDHTFHINRALRSIGLVDAYGGRSPEVVMNITTEFTDLQRVVWTAKVRADAVVVSVDEDLRDEDDDRDDEDPTYTVSDNGGDWDDESGLDMADVEGAVEERVDHYLQKGALLVVGPGTVGTQIGKSPRARALNPMDY